MNADPWLDPDWLIAPVETGSREENRGYDSTIDDIHIYNRALSPQEIHALIREGGWTGQMTEVAKNACVMRRVAASTRSGEREVIPTHHDGILNNAMTA